MLGAEPMHGIIEATGAIGRRHGVDVDRTTARLALLAVVEHLDRVLQPAEIAALATSLPLALSIQLRRGPRVVRPPLPDEALVRAACEALAMAVGGPLAARLHDDVPGALLGQGPPARRQPSHADPLEVETVRPPPG